MSPTYNLSRPTCTSVVTRQKGSWKWQDRHAVSQYRATWSRRLQAWIWKYQGCLDDKVKPNQVRTWVLDRGAHLGGRHNRRVEFSDAGEVL